jgi:biopolymer transport protein ExbB
MLRPDRSASVTESLMSLVIHLITIGGGLPLIMAVLLLMVIAIIIDRTWFFHRIIGAGRAIEHDLRETDCRNGEALKNVANRYENTLQARLVLATLNLRNEPVSMLSQHLEEEIMWAMPRLDRFIWLLDTAVTLAPLFGLFGTIIGMIDTFNVLGNSSQAIKATGGIADALVSTGMGLFIAIISIIALNYFNKKLRLTVHQLELIRLTIVNRIQSEGRANTDRQSHKPAAAEEISGSPVPVDEAYVAEGAYS